ncbi:hypothetical protein L6164_026590 [Bauhinia variegata]|uniref:Uncharacterized protein n=1 Tax=Bauhinia variegata TaxID=167791 RepID=A0ACB9LQU1_BAUVA|nr:hypothetical protein L6164_026590 [Bauhinia variegata]
MRASTLKLLHIFSLTNSRSISKPSLHLVPLHFQSSWLHNSCFERSSLSFGSLTNSIAASNSTATCNGNVSAQPYPQRTYQVVVAATRDMGIGKDGKLPWRLPTDLKFFKEITMTTCNPGKKNAVLMGRKTWESIPVHNRPLPGRLNVILTRSRSFDVAMTENVVVCGSMSSALELLAASPYSVAIEKVFIIGGGQIFREALNAHGCDAIHITEIETSIECDTFIPPIEFSMFQPWYSSFPRVENHIRYSFTTYVRIWHSAAKSLNQNIDPSYDGRSDSIKFDNRKFSFLPKMIFERHEEYQYLRLLQEIIIEGTSEDGGTGSGTLSKFGYEMRFNLRKSFPLLTTKKLSWNGVVGELLWFISGSTNVKQKGFCMLDDREHLDSIGLTPREEGDLGPVYGFQWRHFGARYTNMHADYSGQGYDQLLDVINKIKNDPDNQEIILPLQSPDDLKLIANFYVANGELSCQIYEQSADMGVGLPYSIASYALLSCLIAHVCELVPGDFIHVIGDARVSLAHMRPLQEQLKNLPRPFPVLKINPKKKDIDSFVVADFELTGYDPHEMIV